MKKYYKWILAILLVCLCVFLISRCTHKEEPVVEKKEEVKVEYSSLEEINELIHVHIPDFVDFTPKIKSIYRKEANIPDIHVHNQKYYMVDNYTAEYEFDCDYGHFVVRAHPAGTHIDGLTLFDTDDYKHRTFYLREECEFPYFIHTDVYVKGEEKIKESYLDVGFETINSIYYTIRMDVPDKEDMPILMGIFWFFDDYVQSFESETPNGLVNIWGSYH